MHASQFRRKLLDLSPSILLDHLPHYLSFLSFRILILRHRRYFVTATLITLFCYYLLLNLSGLLSDDLLHLHLLHDLVFNYLICRHLIVHFHFVAIALAGADRLFTPTLASLSPLTASSDVDRHLNFCHRLLAQNFANLNLHAIEERRAAA